MRRNLLYLRLKGTLERKLTADVKKNPKAFYRHMNSRCKVLRDSEGTAQTDDAMQATILNNMFSSYFT